MRRFFFLLLICATILSCQAPSAPSDTLFDSTAQPISIIPQPESIEKKTGHFVINNKTQLVFPNDNAEWQWIANSLQSKIGGMTVGERVDDSNITFKIDKAITNPEGYELDVAQSGITITSGNPHGAYYAVQTLLQLFPKEIYSNNINANWTIPQVKIKDAPRFKYRGMHLDVCRHFFGVDEVKKYIDLLVMHKMNTFHWHLTEDQGWRIEIKQYPKLTEIGGYRNETLIGHYNDLPHQFDGKRYGGFYTQEEVKEIVQYAKERFITVLPEIELPGHAQAAIAAYPELGCKDGKIQVLQKWGVSDNVYCPTEETFTFLENVLKEVMPLFPGEYVHIGGDECPKTQWKESAFCQNLMKQNGLKDEMELQSYFIKRIEKFINANGKQIIGWDEILEGGLAPNATVMSWRGIAGGIEAAKEGHDVVMTPTTHCYLDYYQSGHPDEPLAIGGYLPLKAVYSYEPVPEELTAEEAKHIIGTQGNVWTEYMKTFEHVEYMAYPRACALAEIAWSPKSKKNFPDFVKRLIPHLDRLEALNVNAANHLYELQTSIQPSEKGSSITLQNLAKDAVIHYTLDGSEPTTSSENYNSEITIDKSSTFNASSFKDGKKVGRGLKQTFNMHKATGKKITLKSDPHTKYKGGGNGSIINGVLGADERYGDAEWLGFPDGNDFEAVIEMEKEESFKALTCRFFKGEGQWIYLPKSVKVYASKDGKDYQLIGQTNNITSDKKVATVQVPLKSSGNFVKVFVENNGVIPEGRQGGGHKSWLFVDELVLE